MQDIGRSRKGVHTIMASIHTWEVRIEGVLVGIERMLLLLFLRSYTDHVVVLRNAKF